jgi:hypothetical protein
VVIEVPYGGEEFRLLFYYQLEFEKSIETFGANFYKKNIS